MSYLVLARKYRPQTFSEVVGQEHVTRTLANAFTADRVHHAFLFCGPRGVGKTTLARILGKALNCERGPTAEPCGECTACVSITGGSSVDYYEMDGASNRGIDAIRELTEAVRYQPAVLRKKLYVIDEVHMLTTEAFNALLKTLEEPPPHVSFVLATTEPHKVPNTILSRCQRYDFKLVPAPRLAAHIAQIFEREQLAAEPGAVSLIVRESGGSVRDALSLCDQIISYVGADGITEAAVAEVLGVADRALTRTLVTALANSDTRTALETVDAAAERGVDEVQVARAIVRYLRDLAVAQVAPESERLLDATAEDRAALIAQARELERTRVVQMFDRMIRACEELGKTQQPRLVLDLALIDVATLEPLLPLGDLIDRLADLERRLSGGGTPDRRGGSGGAGSGGRGPAPRGNYRADTPPGPPSQWLSEPPGPPSQWLSEPPPAPEPPPARAQARPEPRPTPPAQAKPEPPPAQSQAKPEPRPTPPAAPAPEPPFIHRREPEATATSPEPEARAANAANAAASAPTSANAPSTATGASAETGLAGWESVLAALDASRKMSLYGFFEHAKVLTWTDDAIAVGFSPELGALAEMALDSDHIQAMKAFLHQHFGRPIGFSARMLAPDEIPAATESVLEQRRRDAEEERTRRETEARTHPMIRAVIDTFGGSIEEIKIHV